jgi:uncharacterized membrane protein HdeD (DUF308 family)
MNETTLFVAKMMAPYLFVTGLGFFFSKRLYLKMLNESESAHPITVNLSGIVHFLIGMAVVLNHMLWGSALEVTVTLIGFAFLVKGVLLILLPEVALKSNETTVGRLPIIGIGFLIVSIYLAYAAYF